MSATAGYKLFTPLTLSKNLVLNNRAIMAPMTRARADTRTREANETNEIYYEQRAGAGLIISEATAIATVDRVHAKNGKIFAQLCHMGRQSHSSFNGKKEVVAPSAIAVPSGQIRDSQANHAPHEMPRALEAHEIPGIVDDFRKSAALAKKAGFDGVEVHGGNGYLVDTFLQSSTNHRTDQYGGSVENRSRILLEIIDAVKNEWSSDHIGVRLAPNGAYAGMGSSDNFEQFTYTAVQLDKHNIGYIAILGSIGFGYHDKGRLVTALGIKKYFSRTVIATNSYTRDIALGCYAQWRCRLGIVRPPLHSNPDLAERFQNDWPLNPEATYADYWAAEQGAEGYTTFPAYTPKE